MISLTCFSDDELMTFLIKVKFSYFMNFYDLLFFKIILSDWLCFMLRIIKISTHWGKSLF